MPEMRICLSGKEFAASAFGLALFTDDKNNKFLLLSWPFKPKIEGTGIAQGLAFRRNRRNRGKHAKARNNFFDIIEFNVYIVNYHKIQQYSC